MTELIWDGKYKDGKKVAPVRIALPFQTIETINKSAHDQQLAWAQRRMDEPQGISPFLKWAGGKQWLLPLLKPLIALGSGRYIEPFLGGGAVFFSTCPKNALLSDSNEDLIATYRTVREDPEAIIRHLRRFSFTEDCYYHIRALEPNSIAGRAARFIYLNHTCWNGLYRVNKKGHFNVPMGSFDSRPDFVLAERLRAAGRVLKRTKIRCQDFEETCRQAESGDTIYLDPPYTVTHRNNGFLRYNERIFSWADQERLAKLAKKLKRKGCKIVMTNADHQSIAELYSDFMIKKVSRKSLVAGDTLSRRSVSELLITSFSVNHD